MNWMHSFYLNLVVSYQINNNSNNNNNKNKKLADPFLCDPTLKEHLPNYVLLISQTEQGFAGEIKN